MQILTQSHTDQRERRYIKLVTQFGATLTYVWGAKPRDKNPLKKRIKMSTILTLILIKVKITLSKLLDNQSHSPTNLVS